MKKLITVCLALSTSLLMQGMDQAHLICKGNIINNTKQNELTILLKDQPVNYIKINDPQEYNNLITLEKNDPQKFTQVINSLVSNAVENEKVELKINDLEEKFLQKACELKDQITNNCNDIGSTCILLAYHPEGKEALKKAESVFDMLKEGSKNFANMLKDEINKNKDKDPSCDK